LGSHEFTPELTKKPCTFTVTRGDYSKLMNLLVENLEKAKVQISRHAVRVRFLTILTGFVN